MEYSIKIDQSYLGIPIQAGAPEELLEIYLGTEKLYEFLIPVRADEKDRPCDYYSYLNLTQYAGQELTLKGNFSSEFFADCRLSERNVQEPLVRPLIHFTAERGWINDPNGLVYKDGVWHLFFQYNPMNTEWQNMSWGHAESSNLLQFRQGDNVLYPDENGTMYSGCGLVNEKGLLDLPQGALLFYYTAAGDINRWSAGKAFTQRIAYSTDGGKTLVKLPGAAVDVIDQDSRDPKIFWHEETQAYIMTLWLRGYEFGFFRSQNLRDWEMTDSIVLNEAWECPDLFRLDCEGESVWVFTSADGFYYLGEFDGYTFRTDKVQRKAYLSRLPYAAQTYSGVENRVISVPWLRTHNVGKLYTGMMGLPRELGLVKRGEEMLLTLLPVREYEQTKQKKEEFLCTDGEYVTEQTEEAVTELELELHGASQTFVQFFGQELSIHRNVIFYRDERTVLPEKAENIHILIDRGILEIYVDNGVRNVYYETDSDQLQGKISVRGDGVGGRIYIWQP